MVIPFKGVFGLILWPIHSIMCSHMLAFWVITEESGFVWSFTSPNGFLGGRPFLFLEFSFYINIYYIYSNQLMCLFEFSWCLWPLILTVVVGFCWSEVKYITTYKQDGICRAYISRCNVLGVLFTLRDWIR